MQIELLSNFDFLNKEVLKAINKKILDFEIVAGKFVDNDNASVVVNTLKIELRKIVDDEPYQNKFNDWLKNYDEIVKLNISIQKKYNGLKLKQTEFGKIKEAAVQNVVGQMVNEGVDVNFINPLAEALMRNVVLGSSVSDTKNFLESYIFGDEETDGKLHRYAGQLARDSVSQYDGQLNQKILSDYEMDGFAYVGSLVEDSRPFCVHCVADLDGFVSATELADLLDTYLNSDTLSRGMIDGTTAENFAVYRGGWNCRHAAIPVFKDNADKVSNDA